MSFGVTVTASASAEKSTSGSYLAGHHAETISQGNQALDFFRAASQEPSLATAELYSRMYLLALTEGDLDQAIAAMHRAESLGGTVPLSNLTHAIDAIVRQDYDGAIAHLEKDKKGINRLLRAPLTAWALVGKKDYSAALAALRIAPDKAEKNNDVLAMRVLHSALILDLTANPEKAREQFTVLQTKTGLTLRTTRLMGRHLERQGQFDQAKDLYGTFVSKPIADILQTQSDQRRQQNTPDKTDMHTPKKGAADAIHQVSSAMLAAGNWESALALSNMALYLDPKFTAAQITAAGALSRSERLVAANDIYRQIPSTSPYSWIAQFELADNLDRLGDSDEAIAYLRTLATAYPKQQMPRIQLANTLRRHQQYADAIVEYDEAFARIAQVQPKHWRLYYSRGIAYEQTGQWDKAEADFLEALKLRPNEAVILNYLGYSWLDKGLHLNKALELIRQAVKLRPRDGYIVDSLGWGLYQIGDYKAAVKSMERAVMLLPADPIINDHLGDALWQVGRQREAQFQWQRALDLNPDEKDALRISDKLKNGLSSEAAH